MIWDRFRQIVLTTGMMAVILFSGVMSADIYACSYTANQATAFSETQSTDPVEDYYKQHGLEDLIVTYLEIKLKQTLNEQDRIDLAQRLAILYGQMLDMAQNESQRDHWVNKSRYLLELVPNSNTEILRLNIHKASYMRAEKTAELYRLRAVNDDSRLQARRIMSDVASQLASNYRDIMRRIHSMESQKFDDYSSAEYKQAAARLHELDSMASQSAYYAAWALYYKAELSEPYGDVTQALKLFGHILQSEREFPRLDEMPDTLLSYEHISRAALGVALCMTLAGNTNTALDWLDALDREDTNPAVLKSLDAYRLWILFHHEGWDEINTMLDRMQQDNTLNATIARLVTVRAFEAVARTGNEQCRAIAARGISALSDLGQITQIMEIANIYDLNSVGDQGFILIYVLGLKAYQHARDVHNSTQPTQNPEIIGYYNQAQKDLQSAISRTDAGQYPDSIMNARLLIAWSYYYTSQFIEAGEAFRELTTESDKDTAETALWMRIVCLDNVKRMRVNQSQNNSTEPVANTQELLNQDMRTFLDRFPSSRHAGQIRYRLAISQEGAASMERVEMLLDVPPDSPDYQNAQHEAERMLYSLFLNAQGMSKINLAHNYLHIAQAILTEEHRLLFSSMSSDEEIQRYLDRARRVLDVLLTRGVARLTEARNLLDRMYTAQSAGLLNLDKIADELEYRRFQLQMLSGDYETAEQWCEQLWATNPKHTFAKRAMHDMFVNAVQDWRAFAADPKIDNTIRRVYLFGSRLLDYEINNGDESGGGSGGSEPIKKYRLEDSQSLNIAAIVAEAALYLGNKYADKDMSIVAENLYTQLLTIQPRNYTFLKANAQIAEARGDFESAANYWRTNLQGLDSSRNEWFEAKYHVIRLLMKIDTTRAREVIRQHQLLHPELGPEPWGKQIGDLIKQLVTADIENRNTSNQPATAADDANSKGDGG